MLSNFLWQVDCSRAGVMIRKFRSCPETRSAVRAFTLIEALMALVILGIMVTGIVSGFVQAHRSAEWSSTSLAAQSLAMQSIEQARAAKWDPNKATPVDQLVQTNFPTTNWVLDVPISGTNILYGTNVITISQVSIDPPLKEIKVECTWSFSNRGVFTNSVLTYRAPDQ
jgi:prepilin-type N-terminal cleavage/methylation domain-containing protein